VPSEETRERSVHQLRRGYLRGGLSTDTFERRVECALASESTGELDRLVSDLPSGPLSRSWRALVNELRALVPAPVPSLGSLSAKSMLRIGRAPDCEIVLTDESVSRTHAEIVLADGRWHLRDSGSTNGTWVNGRRLWGQVELRRGDVLTFGNVFARF
jgi:hypothetical protein